MSLGETVCLIIRQLAVRELELEARRLRPCVRRERVNARARRKMGAPSSEERRLENDLRRAEYLREVGRSEVV